MPHSYQPERWRDLFIMLGVAGGIGLIAGSDWSFALIAASCIVLMVRAVLSSWSLMFGVEPASTTTDP